MPAALLRKARPLEDEYGIHAVPLLVLLNRKYGPDVLSWTSEALREELEEDFGPVGPVTWERIQAMRLLQAHDMAWREWEVFEKLTAAIMGEPPVFSYVQPPEPEEMAVAVETFRAVDRHEFSPEVQGYIAAACLHDGLWYLYDTPLEFAQNEILAFDRRKNIKRNYGGVADVLKSRGTFLDPPETAADVQANKVLEVRLVVERHTRQVEKQMTEISWLVRK